MKRGALRADMLLLIAAAIWGTGFVAQRAGMAHVGPWQFNGLRFALGAAVLLPVVTSRRARPDGDHARRDRAVLRGGLLAGTLLFVAGGLQQVGLVYTTAGKAGFITGLYVVIVPLLGLCLRRRTAPATWAGAGLAAVGLYVLSVPADWRVNPGDLLVLAGAGVWAGHVLLVGHFSPRVDPFELSAVQFATAAALSLLVAGLMEELRPVSWVAARWAVLYSGVLSVGVAFTLQVIGQRRAPPAHAAILLSLEAVFAAVAGGLVLGESLSRRELIGCALMLAGMLASQSRLATAPAAAGAGQNAS